MNARERFQAIRNFDQFDRLPVAEWAGYWSKTLERWSEDGLPDEMLVEGKPSGSAIYKHLGMDVMPGVGAQFHPIQGESRHNRRELVGEDFVSDEAGYEKLKPFLFPEVPDVEVIIADLEERSGREDFFYRYDLTGFFWWPRVLFGIERHFYAFYDHPDLMRRMNQELLEFNLGLVERVGAVGRPDFMTIREDMSYNNGPMLSRELFDEFLLPYYKPLTAKIRSQGTAVFVDSDGDVNDLAGWLLDAGVEGVLPLEKQAGTDVAVLRERYPKLLMMGAFDKMVMHRGEQAIRSEFERLLPVAERGGFVISVDHQTPPEVSWDDYILFVKLFKEYAERAGA